MSGARRIGSPRTGHLTTPLFFMLIAMAAVTPVAIDLYLPGFPDMARDLGVPATAVQITLTLSSRVSPSAN